MKLLGMRNEARSAPAPSRSIDVKSLTFTDFLGLLSFFHFKALLDRAGSLPTFRHG